MTVEKLAETIALATAPSTYREVEVGAVIEELGQVERGSLYLLLTRAGVECLRPYMSKRDMLQRTRNRLTATARAVERAYC